MGPFLGLFCHCLRLGLHFRVRVRGWVRVRVRINCRVRVVVGVRVRAGVLGYRLGC